MQHCVAESGIAGTIRAVDGGPLIYPAPGGLPNHDMTRYEYI